MTRRLAAAGAVLTAAVFTAFAQQPPVTRTDFKLPKSLWDNDKHYAKDAKVGDFVVYDVQGGSRMRRTVAEKGDMTLVERNQISVAGFKVESEIRFLFTEPDADVKKADAKYTTKKGNEKLRIGEQELDTEWLETYDGDRLLAKAWMSKQVPMGGLIKAQTPDGKVTMSLVEFGRGK
jgi:hypothetical protein